MREWRRTHASQFCPRSAELRQGSACNCDFIATEFEKGVCVIRQSWSSLNSRRNGAQVSPDTILKTEPNDAVKGWNGSFKILRECPAGERNHPESTIIMHGSGEGI